MKKPYKKSRLVLGIGVNDASYAVQPKIHGENVLCPFYQKWFSMLRRCYSPKLQAKHPSYIGCTVCDEWLSFMAFRSWMVIQDWEGKHLDKDLLIEGNKIYSPDTCCFVGQATNKLLLDRAALRGDYPVGVNLSQGKYQARCNNNGNISHLGTFDTPEEASNAYKKAKSKIILLHSKRVDDRRVAAALVNRAIEMIKTINLGGVI